MIFAELKVKQVLLGYSRARAGVSDALCPPLLPPLLVLIVQITAILESNHATFHCATCTSFGMVRIMYY